MQYKASSIPTKIPEKMSAAIAPVAIGTRGTIGSLVRKEIDYFTKIELERCPSSSKPHQVQMFNIGSGSGIGPSRPSFWSLRMSWKRKKRRGNSNGFIPSMCSAVEVADTNPLYRIPGFNYRILKGDLN
ncbi:uncharacterized protein LOC126664676 [Mercurialis annua]|uniref:uncharacterized protein LOC126664676 n=1 Tax=Mercurialis annua TaxID=3986 RepID=UPI00215ECD94|nr:uncharacterized protein LOC126664676 [Mercurialis annua]